VRCLYVDLDGTLLGPGGSLLRGENSGFALDAVRALQACDRAGVERRDLFRSAAGERL